MRPSHAVRFGPASAAASKPFTRSPSRAKPNRSQLGRTCKAFGPNSDGSKAAVSGQSCDQAIGQKRATPRRSVQNHDRLGRSTPAGDHAASTKALGLKRSWTPATARRHDATPRPASENVECTKRGMTSALWGIGRRDRGRRRRRRAIRRRGAQPLCAKSRCKRREDRVHRCLGRQSPLRTRHQRAFERRDLATAILTGSFGRWSRAVHELSIPTLDAR